MVCTAGISCHSLSVWIWAKYGDGSSTPAPSPTAEEVTLTVQSCCQPVGGQQARAASQSISETNTRAEKHSQQGWEEC